MRLLTGGLFSYVTIPEMANDGVSVAVIGRGNWGSSLAAALASAQIPLSEIVVRRRQVTGSVLLKDAALDAQVLWLCVPDGAIARVAEEIVRRCRNLTGQIVAHSSGALAVDVLSDARDAGASIASVHPAMTFPTREVVSLKDVFFGVEAEDARTRKVLRGLVRRLGGKPFDLRSEQKAMYHAAGTLASPLLVSALTAAVEAAHLAGLNQNTARSWVQSLSEPTLRNVFARGAEKSFSGPFARGDAGTIRLHLKALEVHPILADVYRSLARQALETLPVRNRAGLARALGEKQGSARARKADGRGRKA
jgi:predicted short-subunit dehydrogenase-like oxidoreductase (DUF2520 family)